MLTGQVLTNDTLIIDVYIACSEEKHQTKAWKKQNMTHIHNCACTQFDSKLCAKY